MTKTNKVRIYGAGGAGINRALAIAATQRGHGAAEYSGVALDTSSSNIDRDNPVIPFYQLSTGLTADGSEAEGSGQVRKTNYKAIAASIKEMLEKHPPSVFNVVIFSASGGSGSVIGPLMLRELNMRGLPAVAIVIGDDNSYIASTNTLKTLQSLEAIAASTKKPVVMSYHQNSPDVTRPMVDDDINHVLGALSILFSGNNHGMDTRDLINLIHYNNVHEDNQPRLASMHIIMEMDDWGRIGHPISVASLYRTPEDEHRRVETDYHTVGYTDLPNGKTELHYTVGIEDVGGYVDDLNARIEQLERARAERERRSSIVNEGVVSTDDDMVL